MVMLLAFSRVTALRDAREALVREQALAAVRHGTTSIDATISGTKALLNGFAEAVDLATPRASLDSTLHRLIKGSRVPYLQLSLHTAAGAELGVAHAATLVPSADAGVDSVLMNGAANARRFAIGEIRRASARDRRFVMPFAMPVIDRRSGIVTGIASALVLVDSIGAMRAVRELPEGSVLTISDTAGTIVYRTLDAEHWLGRRFEADTQMLNNPQVEYRVDKWRPSEDGTFRLIGTMRSAYAPWLVYVGTPVSATLAVVGTAFVRDLTLSLLLVALVLWYGYRATVSLAEPIESLTADANAIAGGDIDRRSTIDTADEIGDLARAFNQMADHVVERDVALQASRDQLAHVQKMEALGSFAGGIAHDFNNYLHAIIGHTELAMMAVPKTHESQGDLREVIAASSRAADLTKQILVFSRKQVVEPQRLDLNEVVTGIERMLQRALGEDRTLAVRLSATPVPVHADPGQIEQVIVNLVTNARDAMPDGGVVTISTAVVTIGTAGVRSLVSQVTVTDTGIGMSDEVRERIFDPFFSTKTRQHGTGLGLAIAYGIVQQSGGTILVRSMPGAGSTFTVRLPVADGAIAPAASTPRTIAPGVAVHGSGRILVVDDDPGVRVSTERMLRQAGYDVAAAAGGAEALSMLARAGEPFDLLLTDVVMPQMSGADLVRQVRAAHPRLAVLFMTGYADDVSVLTDVAAHTVECIGKPFTSALLHEQIQHLLHRDATLAAVPLPAATP